MMTRVFSIGLVPLSRADLADLIKEPDEFATSHGFHLGAMRDATVDVADHSARFYDSARVDAPWGAYLAIDDSGAQVVGVCSFKGPPNNDRAVEIAYVTFPPYERRGIASAMAAQLVAMARSSTEVELIVAHTLPEENASVRILRRLGFRLVGEVIDDPADGPVWRWELATTTTLS
jgi:[ribosomal protein S5]-alanine N-acetyltransferase